MCGVAFNFMKWLISEFDIVSTKENPEELSISELLSEYLDDQTYAILNYKQKAETQRIDGIVNCKAVDVKRQLDLLFDGNESLTNHSSDDEKDLSEYETFSFHNYSWRVVRKTSAEVSDDIVTFVSNAALTIIL
jgi:1,2-phenylacetyl-CoA epoxidase PaaB subunit